MKAVHIDGLLAVTIACCGFAVSYLDNDESFKYVAPQLRFWTIGAFGFVNAGCAALLFFRNKTYSERSDASSKISMTVTETEEEKTK